MNAYNPIIDPETSVWINASAGTGKTKALTDRILSLLLQGRHNILCMTFTKAAANEMKERVLTCLHKWTYLDRTQIKSEISSLIPTAVQEQHIDIAITMFKKYANSNVSIETIHSFCYNLLLEFSQEIDSNSRIITDTTYLFRKSAISALTDPSMTDEINIIEKYLTSKEQIFYLLEELHKKNHHSYDLSKTENELKKLELSPIQNLELENVIELLRAGTKKDIDLSYNFETLMDPSNWTEENLTKIFLTAQNKPRSTSISKKLATTNPSIQSSIDYIFEVGLQYLSSLNTPKIAAKTSALLKIYNLSMEYYKRKKQESNGLDYNDIIDKAIYLITEYEFKESVLFSLNNRFEHILIDETQDNTPSHWEIIQHICEEFFSGEGTTNTKRTVFFVGDAKQSIYGFLNSSPELFKNMRTFFMSRDHNLQIMQLNKSFRSAKPVLDFVNIIINKIGDYLPDTAIHIPARQDPCCGYVEIWPKFSHPNAAQIDNLNLQQLSAKTIAKKIKTWLDNGRILNAKNRALQPSDIMILFQKRCSLMTYLVDELLANNIPVESIQNPEKDTFIVSNLIAIGNFILQPHNDEALVDVLRSGLVSIKLSEEEIMELMWEKKHGSLWDLLNRETSPLTKQLKALLTLSQTHTPYLLYRSILFNSEYINYPDYYKPIYLFLEELANFEKQNILSLASFLVHIKYSKFRYTHDPQSNCISIRTVHGAKGLQAPVVFIADATSSRSATDSLLFSDGTPFWDNKYHERCRQIRQSNKSKSLKEYMRLFYVAITRAEDELYILGMDVKGEGDNTWYNSIPTDLDTKLIDLNPMFPTEVEARCVNKNYELQYMNQK